MVAEEDWIGRTVVSQYGLVCEVLDCKDKMITCRDHYKNHVWEWDLDTVSLVMKNNQILDVESGEIWGYVENNRWELYGDCINQCRLLCNTESHSTITISPEEIEKEFL